MKTRLTVMMNHYTELRFHAKIEKTAPKHSARGKKLFTLRTQKSDLTLLISVGLKCAVAAPGIKPFKGIIKEKSTLNGSVLIKCQAAQNKYQEILK